MTKQIRGHYGTITSSIEKCNETDWLFRPNSYYRVGFSEDPYLINFVDPAGGPFTKVGMTLRELHKDLPKRSIVSIHKADDGFLFKTVANRKKINEASNRNPEGS